MKCDEIEIEAGLKWWRIEETLKRLGQYCMYGENLQRVTIPMKKRGRRLLYPNQDGDERRDSRGRYGMVGSMVIWLQPWVISLHVQMGKQAYVQVDLM